MGMGVRWKQEASGKGVQRCTKPGTGGGWESDRLPLLDYLLSTVLL